MVYTKKFKAELAYGMYHSCRILGEMCPGKRHETGYYQSKSVVQKMQNHDFLWLLPFVLCVWVRLPVTMPKVELRKLNRQWNLKEKALRERGEGKEGRKCD